MSPGELKEFVKRTPFERFCIYTSDGTHHEIRHPDQIMVDQRICYVGIGADLEGVFQRVAKVSNIHITHLEPFDPPDCKFA